MGEQSLAPEWLSLHKELPSSSQDKVIKPLERERPRRFNKQNSYHHLTPASHPPPHHHLAPSSSSPNWRHASDGNPRMLNRSKSSPGFELEEVPIKSPGPKSPDRTNSIPVPNNDRNFAFMRSGGGVKNKFKPKPPLISSMSSPNLFASDKASSWLHQKMMPSTRSPPVSRSNSSQNISIPVPPVPAPTPVVVVPATPHSPPVSSLSLPPEDLEMEKLRILVPSPAVIPTPKPTRLVEPGNRKGAHPKVGERPKKVTVTLPPQLKKATSETALLGVEELRRAKASKADKTKVKLMEIVEEKEKVVARRGAFFMDVIKREQQLQDGAEEVSDEARDASDKDEGDSDEGVDHRLGQSAPAIVDHRRSPPAVEDEERFLRQLGWVPDEEDHVPELEEDEIAEVRLKINGHGGSPVSPPRTHRFDIRRDLVVSIHQD